MCLFWLISSILSNLHKVSALGHALAVSYVEEALLSNFSFFVFSLAGSMPWKKGLDTLQIFGTLEEECSIRRCLIRLKRNLPCLQFNILLQRLCDRWWIFPWDQTHFWLHLTFINLTRITVSLSISLLMSAYVHIIPEHSRQLGQTYSPFSFVRGRSTSVVIFWILFEARYLRTSEQQLTRRKRILFFPRNNVLNVTRGKMVRWGNLTRMD